MGTVYELQLCSMSSFFSHNQDTKNKLTLITTMIDLGYMLGF
jgi:hypothetical protein